MAYVITEDCTLCAICEQECPTEAIKEGDVIMQIDQRKCNNCGDCFDLCPDGAVNRIE